MRDLCVLFPVGRGSKKFEDWGGGVKMLGLGWGIFAGGGGGSVPHYMPWFRLSVRKDIMMSM